MSNENENQAPSWFIDDGIPGTGQRPSWLPDKYKTVAELARSNAELEKRFGNVPEDYDLSRSRHVKSDFTPFVELKQLAKDKRVPVDVMDKFIDSVDKYIDGIKIDPEIEIKKLGENALERITTLDNWAKANMSEESCKALTGNNRTAETIKALEELRNKMMSNTAQIPGNNGQVHSTASLEDIKAELADNLEKYKSDANYRKDISTRLEVAAKNTPGFVDKHGS